MATGERQSAFPLAHHPGCQSAGAFGLASPQIKREVEIAADGGVTIVPLRIENILPTEAFKYFLGNIHWLDALTPPLEKHLQEVAAKVKAILNTESVSPPEEADRPSAEILKVVYPLASKPAGPEREKPSPPSSGGTGGKSTSKQVSLFWRSRRSWWSVDSFTSLSERPSRPSLIPRRSQP